MKVFVTGPDKGDSFTHNVAHTFRDMGHDVRTDPAAGFDMQQSALRRGVVEVLSRASRRYRQRRDARAISIVQEYRPNLTVMCTMTLDPETIGRMRRISGGPVVCWYGDSPANIPRDHVVSGEYDAVFAKDRDLVRVLRSMLRIEAHDLPEACNPAWHRPVAERAGNAVVIAGTSYGYRNALAQKLVEAGEEVRFYGPSPPLWVPAGVRAAHTGVFLDHRTKARVFGEGLACLSSFALSEGRDSVNCRVFETCGCGGLLLTEEREAVARYFERDREYLAYSSLDECCEHLRRLRKDYATAAKIRANAARRAHAEHTYRHRIESMLDTLGLNAR